MAEIFNCSVSSSANLSEPPSNSLIKNYLAVGLIFLLILQFMQYLKSKYMSMKRLAGDNNDEKVLGLDDIPGPKAPLGLKCIGILPRLLPYSRGLNESVKLQTEFPGMYKATGAHKTFIVLSSGPIVQQLLKSGDYGHGNKSEVFYGPMKPYIKNGVLVSFGKFWYGQRKVLMKSQSWQNLKSYMTMLNKHSNLFVGEIEKIFEDAQTHPVNEDINRLFLKVITEVITGFNVHDSPEFNRYLVNVQIWKESVVHRILNPWLLLDGLWNFHPKSKRVNKAVREMDDFARARLEKHKEMRNQEHPEKSPFKSALEEMLDAEMDEDQIVDEVNTVIFAGHETGAAAVHHFCFSMALNPEIQERCRQEIDDLFETPECFKNGDITYEALGSHLRYVERCILETIRLYPSVFIFARDLTTPLRLEHNEKTYEIPTGVDIVVCPFAMHRDPVVFPNPEKFDPNRFLPEESAKRHAYAFIPFSAGQRDCLGQKLGMMEMKIVVAYLLRKFVITTTDKFGDIPLLPFVTLTPEKDYMFQFKKREGM